jgi:hypothetical protein
MRSTAIAGTSGNIAFFSTLAFPLPESVPIASVPIQGVIPLSRIGFARSPEELTKQIRRGAEDLPPLGYEPVTLTILDGQVIRGVKKNEDVFSIQIMHTEHIHGYLKSELRAVRHDKGSLMPHFGSCADHVAGFARRLEGSVTLADYVRGLQRSWLQPADTDCASNVNNLRPQWVFQTEILGRPETSSLLIDCVLCGLFTRAPVARIWHYRCEQPAWRSTRGGAKFSGLPGRIRRMGYVSDHLYR